MSISLHTLKPDSSTKKQRKRVGRGGKRGTYSGKGLKGQKSRSGASGLKRIGMRQLIERTHKLKGFKSIHKKPVIISLATLHKNFKDNDKITPAVLLKKKLITNSKYGVKILSNGKITIKLVINGCTVSQTAKTAIEKAGGKVAIKIKKESLKAEEKTKTDKKDNK